MIKLILLIIGFVFIVVSGLLRLVQQITKSNSSIILTTSFWTSYIIGIILTIIAVGKVLMEGGI